ncbi:hypothetical protein TNCV_4844051 [Trichonephila clavipes]|uniref:Uncharacterized protein n=1 Tax=Trichonephila clavipes TaxID=2585209 RepID=A0A8X7BLZ5_TRICX|nr:hypothetical protein TNCV_4844051 [Trichonephila clavipes]
MVLLASCQLKTAVAQQTFSPKRISRMLKSISKFNYWLSGIVGKISVASARNDAANCHAFLGRLHQRLSNSGSFVVNTQDRKRRVSTQKQRGDCVGCRTEQFRLGYRLSCRDFPYNRLTDPAY